MWRKGREGVQAGLNIAVWGKGNMSQWQQGGCPCRGGTEISVKAGWEERDSSSLCSLLDLLLPWSVCYSVGSEQVDCKPDTQPLWNLVLAFLPLTQVQLVLGKWRCHHPGAEAAGLLECAGKGFMQFHLVAFAVQKRVRAQSQLGLVSSGRWVIQFPVIAGEKERHSCRRGGRRWPCFQYANEVLPKYTNSVRCAVLALSLWISLISTCYCTGLGRPQRTRVHSEE